MNERRLILTILFLNLVVVGFNTATYFRVKHVVKQLLHANDSDADAVMDRQRHPERAGRDI